MVFVPLVKMAGQVAAPGIMVSAMIERDEANISGSASSNNSSLSQLEVAGINGAMVRRNVRPFALV